MCCMCSRTRDWLTKMRNMFIEKVIVLVVVVIVLVVVVVVFVVC